MKKEFPSKKSGLRKRLNIQWIYLLFLLLICPVISKASAYWMDIKGSGKLNEPVQIKVFYGNIDDYGVRKPQSGLELMLTGEFKITVLDAQGNRTLIPIQLNGDGWEGSFTPRSKGTYQILGINNTHPVVDRSKTGGQNVLPVDYLCASYQVEQPETLLKPVQYLDIITARKNNLVVVKAYSNGTAAAKSTKLRVFNPENWEKELSVDENGEATFLPTMKGLYIIREDWNDQKSGSYKGISYSGIRHRCNYFLFIQ